MYDSASGTHKTRLQKLQTRTARLITGSDPRTSRVSLFNEIGWLSLQYRRDFHKCIMIYKFRNGLAHNIYVICLILTIVCIPTIPEILVSFEPLNHALPTITEVSQYPV